MSKKCEKNIKIEIFQCLSDNKIETVNSKFGVETNFLVLSNINNVSLVLRVKILIRNI